MKKTLLLLSTIATLALTGCGDNYTTTDEVKKPKIGYSDIVNKKLYSFEDVIDEENYDSAVDFYSLECDSKYGVLFDEIEKIEKGFIYSSFVCYEK
jgi:hypothetical protein